MNIRTGLICSLTSMMAYAAQMALITALLANIGSQEELGTLGYSLALLTPLYVLCSLNLRTMMLTERDSAVDAQRDYFIVGLLMTGVFLLASTILAVFHGGEYFLLILACGVLKAVELIVALCAASNLKRRRVDLVALCQVLRSTLVVGVFSTVYLLGRGLGIALLAAGIVSALLFVTLDWKVTTLRSVVTLRELRFSHVRKCQLAYLSMAFVAATPILEALLQNSPRYALGVVNDVVGLAVVTVLMYATMPGILVLVSFSSVLIPKLNSLWFSHQQDAFLRLAMLGIGFALCLSVTLMLFALTIGEAFLVWVFSTNYSGYRKELVLMCSAASTWYVGTMLSVAMNSAKKYHLPLIAVSVGMFAALVYHIEVSSSGNNVLQHSLLVYNMGTAVRFLMAGILFLYFHICCWKERASERYETDELVSDEFSAVSRPHPVRSDGPRSNSRS